jgi:hypothetical protein
LNQYAFKPWRDLRWNGLLAPEPESEDDSAKDESDDIEDDDRPADKEKTVAEPHEEIQGPTKRDGHAWSIKISKAAQPETRTWPK